MTGKGSAERDLLELSTYRERRRESVRRVRDAQDPMFEAFRRGSPVAIRVASEQASRVVSHVCGKDSTCRADLVQDVLSELWGRLGRPEFRSGRTFDAFVRSLTYWRCIDHLRREPVQVPIDPNQKADGTGPDEWLLNREERRLGSEVVRRIREPCRELFRLHAGEGLTYREISVRLGRTEGALRVQMSSCLKHARQILTRLSGRGPFGSDRRAR